MFVGLTAWFLGVSPRVPRVTVALAPTTIKIDFSRVCRRLVRCTR